MSGGGSKNSGSGSSSTAVQIPGFLEPFIRQGTSTAGAALEGLASLVGLGSYVPGEPATPSLLASVRGPGGQPVYVDPAQNAFVDAQGNVIAPFQDGVVPGLVDGRDNPVEVRGTDVVGVGSSGINELFSMPFGAGGGMGEGGGPAALVAPFSDAQLAGQQMAIDRALSGELFGAAQGAASGIASNGVDTSAIDNLLLGNAIPGVANDALGATAAGDFLYGGEGFNAAVDAAVRQATPGILSAFGSAGAGAATGGLAQEALGTAAIDAFARQYAQERSNQLSAANTLGGFGLAESSQALQQALGQTNAQQASTNAALEASRLLPGLATADIDLLNSIGSIQQGQEQNTLDAPRNALLQLLTAALGGTPISSLLGSNTDSSTENRGLFLGFGG